jgi:hypothetical protein
MANQQFQQSSVLTTAVAAVSAGVKGIPRNIAPVTSTLIGVKSSFSYTLPPTSIVVIKFKTR